MRRLVLKGLGATLLGAAGSVRAQSPPPWPSRPVRVVVPFSTGTAADLVARALGTRLSAMWGQSVLIENVQGAGGNIGAATVAKAP
ncbi:MAG: tripartite tricarboxylate transporter substrate binding protein, partial [Burkholderiaceae bacterium]